MNNKAVINLVNQLQAIALERQKLIDEVWHFDEQSKKLLLELVKEVGIDD